MKIKAQNQECVSSTQGSKRSHSLGRNQHEGEKSNYLNLKVMIEDAGNSSFIPGTVVKFEEMLSVNTELAANGKPPAKWPRLALWLTQVAKQSDSWMSAASFQETIRVMVDASTKGAIDNLSDLKANVIIGRLLPVGDIYKEEYYAEQEEGNILESVIQEG